MAEWADHVRAIPPIGFTNLPDLRSTLYLPCRRLAASRTPASAGDITGPTCGVNLALAANLAERQMLSAMPLRQPDLMKPMSFSRAVDDFAPRAAEKNIRLGLGLPASLPRVGADSEKIYGMLFQRLDSALKFTPSGGEVVVSTEARSARVCLSVRDTGPGIPPDRLGVIFQPFRRLEPAPGQLVSRIGLGLALVERLAEAHDLQIEVKSQPNQGSGFTFELPLTAPDKSA